MPAEPRTNSEARRWDWPRKAIPADIAAGKPDVSKWGLPTGLVSANKCDPWKNFKNQQLALPAVPERALSASQTRYIKIFERAAAGAVDEDKSSIPPPAPSSSTTVTKTASPIPVGPATSNVPSTTSSVPTETSSPQDLSGIPACVLTCYTQAAYDAGCTGITGE
ncbi:hypothetical protein QFC24_006610 [Naganishia onofrii]|uniref:Uncharacterized protein n=1 Tax=Naganishia onofrii TaxID=1851511 RepID=A0ACC2X074_9TREE|nr:hypothetical protein QFC24_006610 [Naganishia onofrii]